MPHVPRRRPFSIYYQPLSLVSLPSQTPTHSIGKPYAMHLSIVFSRPSRPRLTLLLHMILVGVIARSQLGCMQALESPQEFQLEFGTLCHAQRAVFQRVVLPLCIERAARVSNSRSHSRFHSDLRSSFVGREAVRAAGPQPLRPAGSLPSAPPPPALVLPPPRVLPPGS